MSGVPNMTAAKSDETQKVSQSPVALVLTASGPDAVARANEIANKHAAVGHMAACTEAIASAITQAVSEYKDEIDRLRRGLEESVKIQAHYAHLLNGYDDGKRIAFLDGDAWLKRLDTIGRAGNRAAARGKPDERGW